MKFTVARPTFNLDLIQMVAPHPLSFPVCHMVSVIALLAGVPIGRFATFLTNTKVAAITVGAEFEQGLTFEASRPWLAADLADWSAA